MIELRGVVASPGARPLSTVLRAGEVVRLDGRPAAVAALCDVLAGRRAPRAGVIVRRGGGGAALVVRAGERAALGVEPAAAVALWRALAGAPAAVAAVAAAVAEDAIGHAAARGRTLPVAMWLVDGALDATTEAIVQAAAETVRAGAGVMVWTGGAGRERVDRVVVVEDGADGGAATPPAPVAPPAAPPRAATAATWRALGRFAAAAASARGALGLGVVTAAWLALGAATVGAHEGFWYAEGAAAGLAQLARLTSLGAVIVVATATAVRAAAAAAWPAMLRETGAPAWARALALGLGDGAGAAVAAAVAVVPAVWARQPGALGVALIAPLVAAIVAGASTRALRGAAALGALAGIAVGAGLLW